MPGLLPEAERPPFHDPDWNKRDDPVPVWVTAFHVVFMVWTIVNAHHPALFVPGLLFFLGFAQVSQPFQNRIDLMPPLLVGFFLAGLSILKKHFKDEVSPLGIFLAAVLPTTIVWCLLLILG